MNRSSGVDLSNYVSNGEWVLLDVVAIRNVVYYPCCPEPFPDVRFIVYLRRRTLYYTYNVIIPCVMLSTLTLLVFWMSPESGEKVTLGLTVLLAFSVFMLLIAENMPATSSYVPLIGECPGSVMSLSVFSCCPPPKIWRPPPAMSALEWHVIIIIIITYIYNALNDALRASRIHNKLKTIPSKYIHMLKRQS